MFYVFFLYCSLNIPAKTVFSLKFRSAGKGPFMAGKAKNIHQRCTFLAEGKWDMARPRLEIQEPSSLKCPSLILTPIFHKLAIVIFRQQLKTFDSNNFTLSSMFSFQNEWPIKTKAVYTIVLFHIFIHFLVKVRSDDNLTLVNLQAVAGGKKCCFRR